MGEIIDIRDLIADSEVEDMTKKEFLKRYRAIAGRIEAKMEQIERMENALYPGAQILTGMPGGGAAGDGQGKADNIMDKLRAMRGKIFAEIAELELARNEIIGAINAIQSETLKELLELRYINLLGWREVAKRMGYTEDNIYKLHQDALKQLRIKRKKAA